jgi:hypothetical protein
MRKLLAVFAAVVFGSTAAASTIPSYVEFLEHAPGETCGERWLLRNNAEPDAFTFGLEDPVYFSVPSSNTCHPDWEPDVFDIRFVSEGGGFNNWFGSILFNRIGDNIVFDLGTFALRTEFDDFAFFLEIRPAPEPATVLLIMAGFVLLARSRRRRQPHAAH